MSSRLLEIAIGNSSNLNPFEVINETFSPLDDIADLPIEPERSSWQQITFQDHTSLNKVYKLRSTKHLVYFLTEIINYSGRIDHHPKITIDVDTVSIELYTHNINDVTDIDLEMSKYVDELYSDIVFINQG